jgi:hypothetical protein
MKNINASIQSPKPKKRLNNNWPKKNSYPIDRNLGKLQIFTLVLNLPIY